jgi:hypothetical protein
MTVTKHIAIIGGSGKLGRYMIEEALLLGYQVTAVCRPQSVKKLEPWKDKIHTVPAYTDDREALGLLLPKVDAVLTVLAPWGIKGYATNTAKAVLDFAPTNARLIFSCGWHISRDGKDQYSFKLKCFVAVFEKLARWLRIADIADQVRATNAIFASKQPWTVVRGCDLEEGESQGMPIWAEHVGDERIAHNLVRRIDFAKFMVAAIEKDELIQRAPAIASC